MAVGDLTTLANVQDWLFPDGQNGSPTDQRVLARLITEISGKILTELSRPSIIPQSYTDISDGFDGDREYLDNWPVTSVQSVYSGNVPIPAAPAPAPIQTNDVGWLLEPWDGYTPGQPQAVVLRGFRFWRGRQNVSITYRAGYQISGEAQGVPLTGPYTITPTARLGPWASDCGVVYAATGIALVNVPSSPSVGQYAVAADGVLTFNSADATEPVLLSYGYIPSALEDACITWVGERYRYRGRIGEKTKSFQGAATASFDISAIPAYVANALQPFKKTLPI